MFFERVMLKWNGQKNLPLVLQHCFKTSWKRVPHPTTHELFLSSDKSGCCTLQKEWMQNWTDSSFTDLNFATKSVHDFQEKLVLQQVTRVSRNFIQTEVGILTACNNLIFWFVESKHSTFFAANVATQVAHFLSVLPYLCPRGGGGGTLGFSNWGCAARTLEPLTYTRASSAEFCYPILA